MKRMRKFLAGLILSLGSVTVGLAGLEVGLRYVDGMPLVPRTNLIEWTLDLIRTNTSVMVHDEMLGWRLREDVAVGQGAFTTGTLGVRMNSGEPRPLPKGAILAVGDSFTVGSGVDDDQTWPAHLERLTGTPVLNGAAGAWGVDQMVLRAEQLGPQLESRAVVVGILAQDSLRNNFEVYGGAYKPFFGIEGDSAVLRGVPVPRVGERGLDLNIWRRVFGHSYLLHWTTRRLGLTSWWLDQTALYRKIHPDKLGVEISCHLMDRLVDLGEQLSARIIVVMQWGAAEAMLDEPPWYGPPVVSCARERGIETLDTYKALHELSKKDHERYVGLWLDEGGVLGHMSAAGNEYIASLIAQAFFEQ